MPEQVSIMLAIWGVVAGFCWIVWVIATNIRIARVARTYSRMNTELVEKLGTSQELLGFLQSDAGRKLFTPPPQQEPRRNPFSRILGSVQAGVVLGCLGLAFLGLSRAVPLARETFLAFSSITGAIGLGLLLSSLLSYRLSRSMGLIGRTTDQTDSY